ncbi:hypothetical protein TNCV_1049781 [Trichonephila clavipes]|nr:hypothetical protein TNCV_1049781 [Trichonephila clavipes]
MGRDSMEDDERAGHARSAITDQNIAKNRDMSGFPLTSVVKLNLASREPISPQLKRCRQNGESPEGPSENLVPELLPTVEAPNAGMVKGTTLKMILSRRTDSKWNETAEQAFLAVKTVMAEATLLRHPVPGAQLSLWVDASDIAI